MRKLHHRQKAGQQLPLCHVMPWSSAESSNFVRSVGRGWHSTSACFVGAPLTAFSLIWQEFIKHAFMCRSAMRLRNTITRQP